MAPLLEATIVAIAGLLLAWASLRFRKTWFVLVGALVFSFYTLELMKIVGSPLHPLFDRAQPALHFWEQLLEAVWCLLGTRLVVGVGRLAFKIDRWPPQARLLPDILSGTIYLGGMLAVVDFVFAIPISGLLATSGVVAIILGLALQNTLGDVFSGIAVGIERPYNVGDVVCVDTLVEGTVIEINWRSTHIRTEANDITIVPNSVVAKTRVVNRTGFSPICTEHFSIALDGNVSPRDGSAMLSRAAQMCESFLAEPATTVVCTNIEGEHIVYEIRFSLGDRSLLRSTYDRLCTEIYRHAQFAGIAIAGHEATGKIGAPSLADILGAAEPFGLLTSGERSQIGAQMKPRSVPAGETIAAQGLTASLLFVVVSGVLDTFRSSDSGLHSIKRLGPGDVVGNVAAVRGSSYPSSVTARTECTVWELPQADLLATVSMNAAFSAYAEEFVRVASIPHDSAQDRGTPEHVRRTSDMFAHVRTLIEGRRKE